MVGRLSGKGSKRMKRVIEFLEKYGIYLLIGFCLALGLASLFFKNATMDDDLYLWETTIMKEALSRGEWIGDYAVGTHGFLFKLPVAIVFLLTGPSLAIATVWNVLLACFSLYLFYIILKKLFPKTIYPFLGSLLLLCNFQFLLNLPTYMREFPVFLSVLILIYVLVNKKSYWYVGLSLLLILDAKEYVFFMVTPAVVIYILLSEWKGFSLRTVWIYLKSYLRIFLPTVVFLLLMIFTSLIPLNMYTLSLIPGVTEGGIEYQAKHFSSNMATTNRIEDWAPNIQKDVEEDDTVFEKFAKTIVNYVGKVLYPRSFSFLSIPKIIFFPALLTSLFLFKKNFKEKKLPEVLLSLILWNFITVFILRASFDRYLFPILPVVIFFFLLFFKELILERKKYLIVLILSAIFAFTGLFFEVDYLFIKIVLNLVSLFLFLLYFLYNTKFKRLIVFVITIVSFITFSVGAFFFYANGQLHQYILWGHDYEVKSVVSNFKNEERIMLNDVGWDILVKVYREDMNYSPEWKWELQQWVPRKSRLKTFEKLTSFNMFGKSISSDKKFALENDIDKIGLMVSTLEKYPLKYQERLNDYLIADWVELIEVVSLKNKQLYIFRVLK